MQDLKNMGKDILKLTSEVAIEIDGVEESVMDRFILRFPDVARDIFKELNNESLTTCRSASRLWCDYLYNQKFWWVRMIQRYRKNMGNAYQQWKKVFKNTPVEFVKEISVSTQQFFTSSFLHFDKSRTEFHWSPLHIAAGQGNLDLCKYIFEKIKNAQPRIQYKWTALHVATKLGHEEVCKFLIDNSEDKNPSAPNGMTPFHYAADRGLTNVCRHIIENVDDKNPAASNGSTPLHIATMKGYLEIVRLIVETGVDKNILFAGKTPLDLVTESRVFRSLTFYKLLSNDNFHLCRLIFRDLVPCLPIFFALLSLITYIILLFLCVYCLNSVPYDVCVDNNTPMGVLISFVSAFLLTIMLRCRP